jgi:hypothetical protein
MCIREYRPALIEWGYKCVSIVEKKISTPASGICGNEVLRDRPTAAP